jgi:hypothetical protein
LCNSLMLLWRGVECLHLKMRDRTMPCLHEGSSCKHGLICCLIGVGTRSGSGYAIVGPISELLCSRQ